jgi:hypothetical protein
MALLGYKSESPNLIKTYTVVPPFPWIVLHPLTLLGWLIEKYLQYFKQLVQYFIE